MSCTIEDWTATATGTGSERVIRVRGEGQCSESGYRLRLKPTNEGIIDDPDEAALELVVEAPSEGAAVLAPAHVETEIHGDPAIRVRIQTPDGTQTVNVEAG